MTAYQGEKMPVIFLGHGSPMNALADNTWTRALQKLGKTLPRPRALLVISAHWMTRGIWVTHMQNPRTIHDFYGFPKELFEIQYPAPGSPELAETVQGLVADPEISPDDSEWGLDHGTWSVLKHVFPEAQIPVVQLSLDIAKPPEFHYQLGQKLQALREQGVLILGSGNIVHNLRRLDWSPQAAPMAWAVEFDQWVKGRAEARDFNSLVIDYSKTEAGRLSVPTPDHYFPLLYILGAAQPQDELHFDVNEIQHGSIAMRSFRFG